MAKYHKNDWFYCWRIVLAFKKFINSSFKSIFWLSLFGWSIRFNGYGHRMLLWGHWLESCGVRVRTPKFCHSLLLLYFALLNFCPPSNTRTRSLRSLTPKLTLISPPLIHYATLCIQGNLSEDSGTIFYHPYPTITYEVQLLILVQLLQHYCMSYEPNTTF